MQSSPGEEWATLSNASRRPGSEARSRLRLEPRDRGEAFGEWNGDGGGGQGGARGDVG